MRKHEHAHKRNDKQIINLYLHQIADLHEKLHKYTQCAEWFLLLQGLIPTDPGCLRRIGEIYDHDFKDKV